MQMIEQLQDHRNWLLLPPGNTAILRFPAQIKRADIPAGMRLASAAELLAANQGKPFPWGSQVDASDATPAWQTSRMGIGGLFHHHWFVTEDGRFGGASNVPGNATGNARACMLLDGGRQALQNGLLSPNEGWALVRDVAPVNADLYRDVTLYAARHVMTDGGAIVISPIDQADDPVYVGFVGNCLGCPNPERISFHNLQEHVQQYKFVLHTEWQGWSLHRHQAGKKLAMIAQQ